MIQLRRKPKQIIRNELHQEVKGVSLTRDAWRRLRRNKMAMAGLVIVVVYILLAILAPVLPIYSYKKIILDHQHLPPTLTKTAGELLIEKRMNETYLLAAREGRAEMTEEQRAEVKDMTMNEQLGFYGELGREGKVALNANEKEALDELRAQIESETMEYRGETVKVHERKYVFGTDYHGRDMLARTIYGGQVSIAIGILGALMSVLIGIIMGSLAGYLGGKVDYIIMRVVDVMYGLPYMLLVIILMAIFGRNILNLFLALSLVSWLTVARVVRGQIISLKNSEFVEAARSIGASTGRIVFRHMVPNTLGIIIVFATLRIPSFIMMEAFLSFLGLGISAPYASWGSLVGDAVEGMAHYPWRLFFPAIAMTLFLFAMNFLGDGLRDAFDPQSKNRL